MDTDTYLDHKYEAGLEADLEKKTYEAEAECFRCGWKFTGRFYKSDDQRYDTDQPCPNCGAEDWENV